MTDKDLQTLCDRLNVLTADQLQRLDIAEELCLPTLKGRSKKSTLVLIRCHLEGIYPLEKRLWYVARLYCWLMEHNYLYNWTVYRVNLFQVQIIYFALHRRFALAMHVQGCHLTFVPAPNPSSRCACIITTDQVSGTEEHSVICLSVWNQLPCVAISAAGTVNMHRLFCVIASVLKGNPNELRVGSFIFRETAFLAANQHFDRELRRRHAES